MTATATDRCCGQRWGRADQQLHRLQPRQCDKRQSDQHAHCSTRIQAVLNRSFLINEAERIVGRRAEGSKRWKNQPTAAESGRGEWCRPSVELLWCAVALFDLPCKRRGGEILHVFLSVVRSSSIRRRGSRHQNRLRAPKDREAGAATFSDLFRWFVLRSLFVDCIFLARFPPLADSLLRRSASA